MPIKRGEKTKTQCFELHNEFLPLKMQNLFTIELENYILKYSNFKFMDDLSNVNSRCTFNLLLTCIYYFSLCA